MNVERFSIPELLFHPSDIGIQEMGVAEAVIHTVSQTPPGSVIDLLIDRFIYLFIELSLIHQTSAFRRWELQRLSLTPYLRPHHVH